MSGEKPGIFKRIFSWIGKIFVALRWIINILMVVIFIAIFSSFIGGGVKPLPEKAPLRLMPSGVLVEERTYTDPITQALEQSSPHDAETPIRDLIDALKNARSDDRITGLILDLKHLQGGGIAKLSEVGQAIGDFKTSGKPVVAVSDSYSQEQYYLASFADEILVNPMGGVLLTGYGYYGSYFKDALDKLKINVHVFRAGKFKSAVEPFTSNAMSDQARSNASQWVGELWDLYTSTVESNRGLAPGSLSKMIDDLDRRLREHQGDLASLALDAGLADRIYTRPQLRATFGERFGTDDDGYLNIHHKDYLQHLQLLGLGSTEPEVPNIGLVVASGTIMDGEQREGSIGGDSFSALMQQAREDDSLKALVIRVDSPGGSAFASDLIRHEIEQTRQQMPVVISMGSLAASGGYWISAGADEIWALPSTLTGSIGVFGIIPTFEDSLAALGVNSDGVGTTELADFNHLDRPLSEQAGGLIQLSIDNIYQKFLDLVARGRNIPLETVDDIAQGRVWTGRQALEHGLVDQLGNLDQAVASAALRAGLGQWQVKPVTRPLSFQEQFLKQLAEGAAWLAPAMTNTGLALPPGVFTMLGNVAGINQSLGRLNDPHGIYLQCFGCPAQ